MNAGADPASLRPPPARTAAEPAPRTPTADRPDPRGDAFERLLQRKASARDDDSTTTTDDDEADGAPPLPSSAPPHALPARRIDAPPAAPAGVLATPSETASRLGAALHADVPPGDGLGALRRDAALAFEVTLNDPRGIGLELRALRAGGSQAGAAPAAWSLTVGSGLVDASVLARHAPRLNERLQARVVTHAHVRVEGRHAGDEPGGDPGQERSR